MSAPPRARWKKRLAALALALALAFATGELLARGAVGAPLAERLPLLHVRANPFRGWEMVPGEHYTYQHRVHVNAHGLRGEELGPKAAGEFRILFLGDSLVYGQGVGEEDTVPAALEAALAELVPERAVRVLNAGHRAYGTAQELGLLRELGPALAPDLVLLGWYWNDVSERPIEATFEAFRARGEFVFDTGGKLAGWALWRWRGGELLRRSALVMLLHDLASPKDGLYAPEVAAEGFARLPGLLASFQTQCLELGARAAVALFPDRSCLTGSDVTRAYDDRLRAATAALGLPTLELLEGVLPLYRARGRLPVLPFDGHYDASANQAMGAHLARALVELGLVPSSE
jgi:lysophospholipase L1-like esterase